MRAVSPVKPGFEDLEIKVAEHQPQYLTLPALPCGAGVLLTRWEFEEGELEAFERGQPVHLHVMHGPGGTARPHRLEAKEPEEALPPAQLAPWLDPRWTDTSSSPFIWRPSPEERAVALASESLWLFLWTGGNPVQPLMMYVGEV